MAKRLILLFLIFLFIFACTYPGPPSYESATKWHSECYPPYRDYHPGDMYTVEDDFINECNRECIKKLDCNESSAAPLSYESERELDYCVKNINPCIISCILKAHSIAYHIEGGYYSDGSYYAGCQPFYFSNIHPTAEEYKKTKWQSDRDDCMKLTSENVKPSWWGGITTNPSGPRIGGGLIGGLRSG